jgi:RimJ/RimL family protein N-acetyltransferase
VVRLRDLRPEDKEKILDWRNQPSVAQYQYTDHTITSEEHEKWFARAVSDPTVRYWVITWNDEDVGLANLYDINERCQRGYWAFYLAQDGFRGKGIGSEGCSRRHSRHTLPANSAGPIRVSRRDRCLCPLSGYRGSLHHGAMCEC